MPQQQRLGLRQFGRTDVLRLHLPQVALHQPSRLGDIGGIASIIHRISGAGFSGRDGIAHRVNISVHLPQFVVQPRGVESPAQYVIAQLDRIIIRVETIHSQLLGEHHRVLHASIVRYVEGRGFIQRHRGQRDVGLRSFRFPLSETILERFPGFFRRDVANHDNVGQIGAKNLAVICLHVVHSHARNRLRRGFAQFGIVQRKQGLLKRPIRAVGRAHQLPGREFGIFFADDFQRVRRQPRSQLVGREQLHPARKILLQNA